MPVDVVKHANFKIFQRTDVQSQNVIIFAHGRNAQRTCVVPANATVHAYIDDDTTFNFMQYSFTFAFEGKLKPLHTWPAGAITDYKLSKAAGTHIDNRSARQSDHALEGWADQSDALDRAFDPDPAQEIHLGAGVPCDIVSIRNRVVGEQQTLGTLLNHPALAHYTHVHCFFCRAKKDGSASFAKAPNKIGRA